MATTDLTSEEEKKAIKKLLSVFKTFGKLLCFINEAKGKDYYQAAGVAHAVIAQKGDPEIVGIFFEVKKLRDDSIDGPEDYRFFNGWLYEVECRMHDICWEEATHGPAYQRRDYYGTITQHREFYDNKKPTIPDDLQNDAPIPFSPSAHGDLVTKANLEVELKKVRDLFAEKLEPVDGKLEELDSKIADILRAVEGSHCSGLKKSEMTAEIQRLIAALASADGKNVTITGANAAEVAEAVKTALEEFEDKITAALEAVKSKGGGVTAEELESVLEKRLTAKENFRESMENWFEGRIADLKKIWDQTFISRFSGLMKAEMAEMPKPGTSWVSIANLLLLLIIVVSVFYSQSVDRDRVVANSNELNSISVAVGTSARQDSIQNLQIEGIDKMLRDLSERAGADPDSLPGKVYIRKAEKPFVGPGPAEEPNPAEVKKADTVDADKKDSAKK